MRLNHTLGELNDNDFDRYGEWRYHITVMGKPSATEPWGWQLDGHHAIINYFVLGDQVVMTPFFAGSEPVTAASGKYKGTSILQDEQNKGLAMINALGDGAAREGDPPRCRRPATTTSPKRGRTTSSSTTPACARRSCRKRSGNSWSTSIALYVDNMDDGHARVKMDEVRRQLDRTWFAWIGSTEPGGVFYYRIHSPVILIEFDHQVPANLRHLAKDPNAPNPSTSTSSSARRTATTTARICPRVGRRTERYGKICCGFTISSIRTTPPRARSRSIALVRANTMILWWRTWPSVASGFPGSPKPRSGGGGSRSSTFVDHRV